MAEDFEHSFTVCPCVLFIPLKEIKGEQLLYDEGSVFSIFHFQKARSLSADRSIYASRPHMDTMNAKHRQLQDLVGCGTTAATTTVH